MEPKEKHEDLLAETADAHSAEAGIDDSAAMRERIQQRAYQLWQMRGGGAGGDFDDWLQAEAEVNAALGSPEHEWQTAGEPSDYRYHATAS